MWILRSIWDWICSWALGFQTSDWMTAELQKPDCWVVVWIDQGKYAIVGIYYEEIKALTLFANMSRLHPDRYIWVLKLIDIHRPQVRA